MKNWNFHDWWYFKVQPDLTWILSLIALIISIIALLKKL